MWGLNINPMRKKKEQPELSQDEKRTSADAKAPIEPKTLMDKKREMLKTESFETIEMIKEAGGMKVGFQKKLPARLAKQMVELGNAKII